MARSMIARQNIKLNLVPGGVPPVLNVSQYDSAYDVHFTIYNGAQLFEIPDDVSIQFQETKRDGNGFTVGATKSAQTGQCYIWMQEQMSAVPGDQICELVLTNTTEDQIGTANFIMRVEPAALNKNTVISESEIAYANQVLAQLGSVAAYKAQLDAQGNEIDQLNTNLAAEVAARQAADNTLQGNINSEAATRATADASLQSQINQLVAPEGAAPSAAEVENARVGADGTVYQTLGDAIRGQVTDVKTAIDYSNDAVKNIEDILAITRSASATSAVGGGVEKTVIPFFNFTSGDQVTVTIPSAISNAVYIYVYYENGTRFTSQSIAAGNTSKTFTVTETIKNGSVSIFTNGTTDVTVAITSVSAGSKTIDEINIRIDNVEGVKTDVEALETMLDVSKDITVTQTVNNATVVAIPDIDLSAGDAVSCTLADPIAKAFYLYVYDENGNRFTSRSITAGNTSTSVTINPAVNHASIRLYTSGSNAVATVTVTVTEHVSKRLDSIEKLIYPSHTVKTIGHRGNIIDAPQNTAPAYIIARQAGISVMENDLEITDDGHFVMWHDGYLHILGDLVDINGYLMYTDGSGYYYVNPADNTVYTWDGTDYVASSAALSGLTRCNGDRYAVRSGYSYGGVACIALNFDTLRRVDFGAYKSQRFKGTQILTFEGWLILCKRLGCEIYVDRKLTYTTETLTAAATLVKKYGFAGKSSWLGLSVAEIDTLRTVIPGERVGLLANPSSAAVDAYAQYNVGRGFFFDGNASTLTLEAAQIGLEAGYDVECYYVGYSESQKDTVLARINELIAYGVVGITCDKYTVEDATYSLITSY